jgi:hypothetical protein
MQISELTDQLEVLARSPDDFADRSHQRKPTVHTAWMLNRVANGDRTREARTVLIELMERAQHNPAASEEAVAALRRFLVQQRKLLP